MGFRGVDERETRAEKRAREARGLGFYGREARTRERGFSSTQGCKCAERLALSWARLEFDKTCRLNLMSRAQA